MKNKEDKVDYCGENVGIRVGADRCQAIVRDHDKKTWSIYGAPDSYPREQKYWTGSASGFSIVRLAVQVLRNEVPSDLLDVLTGKTSFTSAAGCTAASRIDRALAKRASTATAAPGASAAKVRTPIPIQPRVAVADRLASPAH